MKEWETEDEYAAAARASLPTPTDTPYRTPSRGSRGSRRSSRQKSNSPGPSSSPPPLPSGDRNRRESKDIANDESISILDPRRFTPTLHANLVSEILALRRDQDEKTKTIDRLESALDDTRGAFEQLESTLLTTAKESRSLKRQLALLEGGTSSALSELARERDEAVDTSLDIKKRLEASQKKVRAQEDDSDRMHKLWARDKDTWEEEKRKYERKIHVAEGRLKTVLEEVAAYQASHQNGNHEVDVDEQSKEQLHNHGSDTASVRTMSLTNSIRFSMMHGSNGYGTTKLNGMSLADELNLDDDDDVHTDQDGRESVMSMRQKRPQSRESMNKFHQRNQSVENLMRPGSVARGRLLANQAGDRRKEGIREDDESVAVKFEYVDVAVQYSPPPSPKMRASQGTPVDPIYFNGELKVEKLERSAENEQPAREWEVEANQRRKRVHATPPLTIDATVRDSMVSAASQTLEDPLSPPRTPDSPTRSSPPVLSTLKPEMTSSSTQTETVSAPKRAPPPVPIAIPTIQLHPPRSAPGTPRLPLLPQHSKDAGCQVSIRISVPSKSVSVQTEEIRVDKRLNFLPPHLQPSSISSQPPSPEPTLEETKRFSPIPGNLPPRNPRRIRNREGRDSFEHSIPSSPPAYPPRETRDAYPGNNDNGPLAKDKGSIRRPHRVSSLFAGFDNASSDDADEFADGDVSDNDYRTALSAPKPHSVAARASKRVSAAPTSVPENDELSEFSKPRAARNPMVPTRSDSLGEFSAPAVQSYPQRNSMKSTVRQLDKPLVLVTTAKPNAVRRTAIVQSGVAAHQGRNRSPSLPEAIREPPFPIPTRASSRRPPISASAPSDGTRSPTWGRGFGRGPHRSSSIRKVRSAAAIPRSGRSGRRQGSRSPPPMSASTEAPESPRLPPMPYNDITTPGYVRDNGTSRYQIHRQQPSAHTANTTNTGTASVGSSSNATSVVDAIAQTMVGEWMFKYVRRRKSFGVPEKDGAEVDGVNGVRHKRWVWLAPYERAVMWSSKQPTSGSALLGKTGRKLTIQSVLDVKDDNPSPKGTGNLFNRSILILTPARALKFTAISAERHYVWLTALSFLAHSSQAVPEITQTPIPTPQPSIPNFEIPRQGARLRKHHIRDSIRVAKGKTAVAQLGPTSVQSSISNGHEYTIREADSYFSNHTEAPADPPTVPRFSDRNPLQPALTHVRRRSNTGSRVPPPLSFRGFSGPATTVSSSGHAPTTSTAGFSIGTNGSSDIYTSQASGSVAGYNHVVSASGRSSVRTSGDAVTQNFFDAVGTVRMEAFISPVVGGIGPGALLSQFDEFPNEHDELAEKVRLDYRRRSRERKRRSRNRESNFGVFPGGTRTGGGDDEYDPFRGF